MKNNNQAVIRKLTGCSLRSDRQRNIFITAAIALTALLLASVFSIGMSYMESQKMQQVRLVGTIAHAAITGPSEDELARLKALDYIASVGTGNTVASILPTPETGDISLSLRYEDRVSWEQMRLPAFQDIAGTYPQGENEIMPPLWVLERMGIEPELGMEIPLSYRVETGDTGVFEDSQKVFRLSGWFTSYMHIRSGNIDNILVSEAFSKRYGKTLEQNGAIYIMFKDGANVSEYCKQVERDLNITDPQRVRPVPAYNVSDNASAYTFIAYALICAFIVFTGYLLIYNVMYISVAKDVRFYGLLKTLGSTPRQIRGIVLGQTLRLCVIGIPIGLALAAVVSLVAVPALVALALGSASTGAVVSFSPHIYAGAAAFAVLTALLGATKPAGKAAAVSPVEAEKYTGSETMNGKARFPARGKPHRMAIRNMLRDEKRTGVVLLSLFLGLTTFMTVTALVSGMDTDNYVDSYVASDFVLKNNTAGIVGNSLEPQQKFDDSFLAAVRNIPGFESMRYRTSNRLSLEYDSGFYEYLLSLKGWNLTPADIEEQIKPDGMNAVAYGVGVEELAGLGDGFDREAFDRGDFLLLAPREGESLLAGVEAVTIHPASGEVITVPVAGIAPQGIVREFSLAPTLIMSNSLMDKLAGVEAIRSELYIDVAGGYDQGFLDALAAITDSDFEASRLSRIEVRQEMNDSKLLLFVLGGGIAFVLGLIGVINFINVMSVSVLVRKHELAALESIGMTRRQTRAMLLCEGVGYAAVSLLSVLTFGSGITYGVFKLFQQQADYAVFNFPVFPALAVAFVILLVCIATPEAVYRGLTKSTVAERLRDTV